MRWFKVAALVVGVIIAFMIVSSVVGFLVEGAIAVLVVAALALGVKVALNRRQISRMRRDSLRGSGYSAPLGRRHTPNVDDELSRLKRESGR